MQSVSCEHSLCQPDEPTSRSAASFSEKEEILLVLLNPFIVIQRHDNILPGGGAFHIAAVSTSLKTPKPLSSKICQFSP